VRALTLVTTGAALADRFKSVNPAIAFNRPNPPEAAVTHKPLCLIATQGPVTAVGSAVRIVLPIEMIPIIRIVIVAGHTRTKVENIRSGWMGASDDKRDSQNDCGQRSIQFHDSAQDSL
jgi:hypothetical protein